MDPSPIRNAVRAANLPPGGARLLEASINRDLERARFELAAFGSTTLPPWLEIVRVGGPKNPAGED